MLNRVIGVFLLVYYNQKQQQLTRRANLPPFKKCVTSPSLVPFPPPPPGSFVKWQAGFHFEEMAVPNERDRASLVGY